MRYAEQALDHSGLHLGAPHPQVPRPLVKMSDEVAPLAQAVPNTCCSLLSNTAHEWSGYSLGGVVRGVSGGVEWVWSGMVRGVSGCGVGVEWDGEGCEWVWSGCGVDVEWDGEGCEWVWSGCGVV